MTYNQLIKHFGTVRKAAAFLDVSTQCIYKWGNSGIPYESQAVIQVETGGKLKADKRSAAK
jgi:hypothetical protein